MAAQALNPLWLCAASSEPPEGDRIDNADAATAFINEKDDYAAVFGGSTKKHAERLSQKEIEAEARLMVALAEAERQADEDEDAQPDDGAVEIPSDEEYVA
ncbi:hypothetical protein FB451DRAFT_1425205 [Mycena latifolia]|nr:hypothetical protein FB451DRAFT_1425205 [Mycena latifolia]